ncbi:MAG: hypothetical protein A49_27820 [Methyloceanibacter sp.]|nr:MAG: hypothetical protein A49_27820 [Methyloceanibacter sp.]
MTKVHVARDENGEIKTIYRKPQPGMALEEIDEDSADVKAMELSTSKTRAGGARADGMRTSASRTITHLRKDSAAELETWARGYIDADGITDVAEAKKAVKRIETSFVELLQVIACVARRV